jgi:predicted dehydrogenase
MAFFRAATPRFSRPRNVGMFSYDRGVAGASRPLRIGVIGAGTMGSLHARVVTESSRAELSCVIDPDASVGRALAAKHGSRWLPDLDRVDLIDAVIVASSTDTHRHWVEKAVRERKPVLVEKPMSTCLIETRGMIAEAAVAGVPVMCGFVERFNPAVMLAMDIVKQPRYFQATRHSPYVSRIRSGVAHDLIIHDADLAIQMFGENPDTAFARVGHFHPESAVGAEDVADVHLSFPDGGIATLSASRITQRKIRSISITEMDRLLEIDLMRQNLTIYRHVDNALIQGNRGYRSQAIIDIPDIPCRREALASQFEHFLALTHGAVDADAERRSLLPAHEVLAVALAERSQ